MSKQTAVLFCPGRGSYTKAELGFVNRTLQAGPVADALAASDRARQERGRPPITEVDGADRFRPSLHLDGENAAELIYFGARGVRWDGGPLVRPDHDYVLVFPRVEDPEVALPELVAVVVEGVEPLRAEERDHSLRVTGRGRLGVAALQVALHGGDAAPGLPPPEQLARGLLVAEHLEAELAVVLDGLDVAVEPDLQVLRSVGADRRGQEDLIPRLDWS